MNISRLLSRWLTPWLFALFALNSNAATPGGYTYYKFDPTVTSLNSVDFGITVEADPGPRANVFWSNQFALNNNTVGYTGMQRHAELGSYFLVSIWGATAGRVGSPGSGCGPFDEYGTGYSCHMVNEWKVDHTYQFHLAAEGGGWFGVTVTDLTAGTSFKLGSVLTGATQISSQSMINWTEYWEWNTPSLSNCNNQPYSRAEFLLPIGNSGTAIATVSGTKLGDCPSRIDLTAVGSVHVNAIGNTPRGMIKQQPDLCLDAYMYRSGDPATGYPCHGRENQSWVHAVDKTIRTRSNLCLAALNASSTPGTNVVVWSCGPSDQKNQQWTLVGSELRNELSGLCLNGTIGGAQLTLQKCDQGWQEPPVL